jgi:hypothetical protein
MKRQGTDWQKISLNYGSNKWLRSWIQKKLSQFNNQTTWFKNQPKIQKKPFYKGRWVADKYTERWPTSVVFREIKIKTIRRYYILSTKTAVIKKISNSKCYSRCEEIRISHTDDKNAKWCRCFGGEFDSFLNIKYKFPVWPSNSSPTYQTKRYQHMPKDLHMHVHSSVMH